MLTRDDLDRKFTEKVAEYIQKGYRISTGSARGIQGEEYKVDLTNDKELIRVLMIQETIKSEADDYSWYGLDSMIIAVRAYDAWDGWRTIWNDDGEEVERATYYTLPCRGRKIFADDWEDFKRIITLRRARRRARREKDSAYEVDLNKENVAKIIRRRRGYKRITPDDIMRVYKFNNYYHVEVRCKPTIRIG